MLNANNANEDLPTKNTKNEERMHGEEKGERKTGTET
jgi:hypothetical protein